MKHMMNMKYTYSYNILINCTGLILPLETSLLQSKFHRNVSYKIVTWEPAYGSNSFILLEKKLIKSSVSFLNRM